MNQLLILLDGVNVGTLVGLSLLYIVLPLVALILLIGLFLRRKNKDK